MGTIVKYFFPEKSTYILFNLLYGPYYIMTNKYLTEIIKPKI